MDGDASFQLFVVVLAAAAARIVARTTVFPAPLTVVLELGAGLVLGTSVLGVVENVGLVEGLSTLGLAALLFLGGVETGSAPPSRAVAGRTLLATTLSWCAAAGAGLALASAGLVEDAAFTAVVLSATAVGVLIPMLRDAGQERGSAGEATITGAAAAEVGAVLWLSVLFSAEGAAGRQLVVVGILGGAVFAAALLAQRVEGDVESRMSVEPATVTRLLIALLLGVVALAASLGLDVVLGAYLAGLAASRLLPRGGRAEEDALSGLRVISDTLLVPVFFVASGAALDLRAAAQEPRTLALIPLVALALLLVRAVPTFVVLRRSLGHRPAAGVGVLQGTSLSFIVAATALGIEQGLVSVAEASALVAGGLVSVLIFPLWGLRILGRSAAPEHPARGTSPPGHARSSAA